MNDFVDIKENIGDSVIQHGKFNNRIYLMNIAKKDFPNIIEKLNNLAIKEGYTKIFAKVPTFAKEEFEKDGYIEEAHIPQFYNIDKQWQDLYFMGKYFDESRMFDSRIKEIKKILAIIKTTEIGSRLIDYSLPPEFTWEICDERHIYQIADVYKKVFKTYPFPIHDPQYIKKTMDENFIYFNIQKNGEIIAVSSCEIDDISKTVEMTDFATLPDYQRNGFAFYLLNQMENMIKNMNIRIAYTISRAISCGINKIFIKSGYIYGGTVINNTNISTIDNDSTNDMSFESMNVWYKMLKG